MPGVALVAIPNDWRSEVSNFLISKNFGVLEAASFEAALSIVKSQELSAIVIDIDWIISREETPTTLWDCIDRNLPVLMLIHDRKYYDWFDKAFDPPLRDYCRIPFRLDQIGTFMRRIGLFTE